MPQDAATSAYVIAPPAVTAVPVAGGGAFPVRRIFCVGRNYAAHAREMGSDPDRELPFFFCKPADALLMNDADMPYPPMSKDLHHEMELVVAIGTGGANIAEADALPPGVFNVICGDRDTGRLVVENPIPQMVSITGSVRAGMQVAEVLALS